MTSSTISSRRLDLLVPRGRALPLVTSSAATLEVRMARQRVFADDTERTCS